jgi:four helix bundle protein
MSETKSTFETLEVWIRSRKLRNHFAKLSKDLPSDERYRLKDQMIRASRSVTANIAEGYGRYHYQENIQYCRQARGSLYELVDHLSVAIDEEFINNDTYESTRLDIFEIIQMLNGYINYLKSRKQSG